MNELEPKKRQPYWTPARIKYKDALRCKSCTSVIEKGDFCWWCVKTYDKPLDLTHLHT